MKTQTKMLAAAVAALAGMSVASAQQVANPYSPANGHSYRHGVIPTRETAQKMQAWRQANEAVKGGDAQNLDKRNHGNGEAHNGEFYDPRYASTQPSASAGVLSFGGGVSGVGVLSGQSKVYLVFYGSQWGTSSTDANGYLNFTNDSAGAALAAQKMFKGIGTNGETWSAELTQWCDGPNVASGATTCPSNAAFIPYQQNILAGVWYDNSVASPAQATGTQLAQEAIKAAQHFGNTAAGSNRYTYYVILSPTGTNPDNYKSPTQGYCAWHDYTGDGYGVTPTDIAFSNQPYNIDVGASCGTNFVNSGTAGKTDGYTMTLGHEWHEMMSDQFPAGGWTNKTGGTYNGQENSDECAWIAPGSTGGAANVAFSTGTFAQQASWSNDTGNCAMTHAILTHTGGGNVAPTANFSFVTSGLTANFTDSSTDSDGTIASRSWNFGDSTSSTATNPSHTYAAAGTYTVTETVTDNGGLTASKSSSVTVSTTSSNVLQNGVGVTIASATTNQQQNWTINIPAGASNLVVSISGGTGDADLYTRAAAAPTTTTYDCRPFVSGNTESCTVASPAAGTFYVMVNTYAAYSGVTLKATWSTGSTGGTQLLANTGFESGTASWTSAGTTVITNSTSRTAHGGSYYAWLGGNGTTTTESVSQSVAIPAGKTSASLAYFVKIDTAETTTATQYDKFTAAIVNSSGTVLKTCTSLSNLNKGTAYVGYTCDASAYIGQTVSVKFTATEDSSLQTSFLVDDVTLTVN